MTHDPLCPRIAWTNDPKTEGCSVCLLIARVRDNQNQSDTRMRTVFYEQGERDGYAAALRDACASVGAAGPDPCVVMCGDCGACNEWRGYYRAVAAIEALGDELSLSTRLRNSND